MRLSRLHPLHGLPNRGQIWSWISFDVANQSFTLIINTLLFSIFFQEVVVRDPDRDDLLWNLTYAASMLLVMVASPIAGAIADERAWKKPALLLTGFLCAGLTCALALIGPGDFWLAVLLYVPANFMFSIGENFLASFLPELAAREHFGRVSGFSWACAYAAALLLLAITAVTMLAAGIREPAQSRPYFVFAGVWFFVLAVPTLLWLREKPRPAAPAGAVANAVVAGFRRLRDSARETARFRDVGLLFLASLFYGAGMTVVILFASILAREFGFTSVDLVLFIAVITVSGIAGTLLPAFFQDRLGHKRTTLVLVGLWLLTTAGLLVFAFLRDRAADAAAFPRWPLWLAGNLLGFGLGSLGSANRAFVAYLTPAARSAQFFGVWGMVFKFAAVLAVPFGWAKDVWGTPASLVVLEGFLVVGFVLTLFVDERRGLAAARAADAADAAVAVRSDDPISGGGSGDFSG